MIFFFDLQISTKFPLSNLHKIVNGALEVASLSPSLLVDSLSTVHNDPTTYGHNWINSLIN